MPERAKCPECGEWAVLHYCGRVDYLVCSDCIEESRNAQHEGDEFFEENLFLDGQESDLSPDDFLDEEGNVL